MSDANSHRPGTTQPPRDREGVRRKAAEFFKEKENRSATIYQQMETERVKSDAKTAKLRALRMAKEESDREAARIADENKPLVAKKKKPIVIHTK